MKTTSIPSGVRHINLHYAPRHFKTQAAWLDYAAWLRLNTKLALGLLPAPKRTPLNARVWGKRVGSGFTVEKVAFKSMPGFLVTGNLYRSTKNTSRKSAPGILSPHGHWEDGRLHDHDRAGTVVNRGIQMARHGATVFSYDMVGYNDSCQVPHREFRNDPHWGLSLMGLHTLNSVRALDFLLSLREVDPARVLCNGCSGGGTQTFALMAVDDRLTAAAPIAMISYLMQGGCKCENAPLLRLDGTSVDLARLFAPRPMFMGSCTGDWTKNTPKEELPAMLEIYRLFGAADAVTHLQVDDGHGYNLEMRQAVYGWLNRLFYGAKSAAPLKEDWIVKPPLRERMLWWGTFAPKEIPEAEFNRMWRARAEEALESPLRSPESARKALGPLLEHALGVTLTSVSEFAKRKDEGVRVEAEDGTLVVASTGRAKDLTGTVNFYTAYNRCFIGDRVHEVLAALDKVPSRVALVGKGEAGIWCLLAAALSKRVKSIDVDMSGFDPSLDASWSKHLDVPCIRQLGGLATVFAMIGRRPLTLRHATADVRALAKQFAR